MIRECRPKPTVSHAHDISGWKSCVYEGTVFHARVAPQEHFFEYRIYMMFLDLGEIPHLFRRRWLWSASRPAVARFRREDHHGPAGTPLDEAIRNLVAQSTGRRPAGPIRLLTHLRYFGYVFNPVSFYYCYDQGGREIETIVAEINNTPWGEQHCYVLDQSANAGTRSEHRFRFNKEFHISPFMDMGLQYDWRFSPPGDELRVHMENYELGRRFFSATMNLRRREINGPTLSRVLLRYPLMSFRIIAAIYWQALRLKLKGAPFFSHPRYRQGPMELTKS